LRLVEAGEIRVRVHGGVVWVVVALVVDSHFCLGAVAVRRDCPLAHLLPPCTLALLIGRAILLTMEECGD